MALLNLRAMNESLERLYGIDYPVPLNEEVDSIDYSESKVLNESLNEAWDPSWPKWLGDRMEDLAKQEQPKYKSWKSNWRPKTNNGLLPDYKNTRDEDKYSRGAWNNFAKLGVPLNKLKVEEGPVPEKRTDPRLKDETLIPVWGFPNGQVYITGFNESEEYVNPKAKDPELNHKAFKYMGTKYLLSEADKFAVIKKIDVDSLTGANDIKRSERASNKIPPEYDRTRKASSWQNERKDKSGYIVSPKKYEKKLARMKAKNIYYELDKFYDMIQDYKVKVHDYLLMYDPFSDDSASFSSRAENLMDKLSAVASRYNRYMQQVDRVFADTASYPTEEIRLDRLANIIDSMRNDSSLEDLKSYGSDKFYSDIDWE